MTHTHTKITKEGKLKSDILKVEHIKGKGNRKKKETNKRYHLPYKKEGGGEGGRRKKRKEKKKGRKEMSSFQEKILMCKSKSVTATMQPGVCLSMCFFFHKRTRNDLII